MRIFKRGDKPAMATESASVLGDNFFDRQSQEGLHLLVDLGAEAAELTLGDPAHPWTREGTLAFYVGWPNAFSALPIARDVFEKRAHAGK